MYCSKLSGTNMGNKIQLSGRKFGRLSVIRENGRDSHGAVLWLCACVCGKEKLVRGACLTGGTTKSCGCLIGETAKIQETTHGKSKTPIYIRWRGMKSRCDNPKNSEYKNYGARGISYDASWAIFENFYNDMYETFRDDLYLERTNNDKGYSRENCVWVSYKEQQRNKRNNHLMDYNGQEKTISEWAEETGIKANTILYRLRRGWSTKRTLETLLP